MRRQDLLLIVLAKAEPDGLSAVQLQKSIFLIQELCPAFVTRPYKFFPYHYGPFTKEIYTDFDVLLSQGLTEKSEQPGGAPTRYAVTSGGKQLGEQLLKERKVQHLDEYLNRLVPWIKSLTFSQLVSTIYKQFPKLREKSIFIG